MAAASWTLPVLGPDGDQLHRPIPGSGTSLARPVWKRRTAMRGEVVDLPAVEAHRLLDLGAVELVEEPSQGLQGDPDPKVTKDMPDGQKPVQDPLPAGKRVLVDDLPVSGGWYTLPGGEKVRGREAAEAALTNLEG
jgi:hypothetical protein